MKNSFCLIALLFGLNVLFIGCDEPNRQTTSQTNASPSKISDSDLENAVRASSLHTRGNTDQAPAGMSIARLLDELGPAMLIEIVDIDGILHVLTCGAGRVRQVMAGRTEDATRVVDLARFAAQPLFDL